jgi:hypothetical protein
LEGQYVLADISGVPQEQARLGFTEPAVPQEALRTLLGLIPESSDTQAMRQLLNCRPYRVVKVSPAPACPVFDLEVSGDHEYSTGGLLTHNCERSADVVSSTFLGEEGSTYRENETTMVCNMKNRDNQFFPPFLAKVDFRCRKLYNFDPDEQANLGISADEGDDPLTSMMVM